jgi:hypothetical protein
MGLDMYLERMPRNGKKPEEFAYEEVEEIGYWRKANQIHKWFVDNVQGGEDDCGYHDEVTKEVLENLLETCKKVLEGCKLVDGEVTNGYEFKDGKMIPCKVQGKYVADSSVAEELLPSAEGFFFGSQEYDQWYIRNIEATVKIVTEALETTDFETQMIYYCSSW